MMILCKLGIHKWLHYNEDISLVRTFKGMTSLTVPIRECRWCGKRQHHLMSKCNGHTNNWKDCNWERRETIEYE